MKCLDEYARNQCTAIILSIVLKLKGSARITVTFWMDVCSSSTTFKWYCSSNVHVHECDGRWTMMMNASWRGVANGGEANGY